MPELEAEADLAAVVDMDIATLQSIQQSRRLAVGSFHDTRIPSELRPACATGASWGLSSPIVSLDGGPLRGAHGLLT